MQVDAKFHQPMEIITILIITIPCKIIQDNEQTPTFVDH